MTPTLLFGAALLVSARSQQQPITVKIVETGDPTGLSDVLIGAFGLTGVIALLAVVFGVATAALMFWLRSRDR